MLRWLFPRPFVNPTIYGTTDGSVHSSRERADAHQFRLNVEGLLDEIEKGVSDHSGYGDTSLYDFRQLRKDEHFRRAIEDLVRRRMR